jgi:hypothetical protein
MNARRSVGDLEGRVRAALRERLDAGAFPAPAMPPSTARQIAVRRTARLVGLGAVVAALATTVVVAATTVGGRAPERPTPAGLYDGLPATWPRVQLDPVSGDEILRGTVGDTPFRLVANRNADGGPCTLLIVGARGHWACTSDARHPMPGSADLYVEEVFPPELPDGVSARLGFVSDRVERLTLLEREDLQEIEFPLLEPIRGSIDEGIRPFVAFVPSETLGWIEAYDAQGDLLAEATLCAPPTRRRTCVPSVHQVASISGATSPAPFSVGPPSDRYWGVVAPLAVPTYEGDAWIEPRFGGDFLPYVDVVDDNEGVVGKKWVLTYGAVGGDRFSLTSRPTGEGTTIPELRWSCSGDTHRPTRPTSVGTTAGVGSGSSPTTTW